MAFSLILKIWVSWWKRFGSEPPSFVTTCKVYKHSVAERITLFSLSISELLVVGVPRSSLKLFYVREPMTTVDIAWRFVTSVIWSKKSSAVHFSRLHGRKPLAGSSILKFGNYLLRGWFCCKYVIWACQCRICRGRGSCVLTSWIIEEGTNATIRLHIESHEHGAQHHLRNEIHPLTMPLRFWLV